MTGTTTAAQTCHGTLQSNSTSIPTCESPPPRDRPVHLTQNDLMMFSVPARLPYHEFFGGVSGLTVKQFKKINGFPNAFWGWGGEDDDLWNR